MRKPRARMDFQYRTLTPDSGPVVIALGETRSLMLEDRACCAVLDLLDGHRGLGDLVDLLSDQFTVLEIAAAVRRLDGLGLLTDGPAGPTIGGTAAWDARSVHSGQLAQLAGGGVVYVVDTGSTFVDTVADAVRAAGVPVRIVAASEPLPQVPPALWIAVVGSMLDERLSVLNRTALDTDTPWVAIRPQGNVIMVGPHFRPGDTGCWECLRQRWSENEQIESYLQVTDPTSPRLAAARAELPSTAAMAAGMLVPEIVVLLANGRSDSLTGAMVSFDTRTLESEHHVLVRQPQCPACGDPQLMSGAPGAELFATDDLGMSLDGGVRVCDAQTTFDSIQRHVSRYLGVVSRLAPMDAHQNGFTFSYGAGHNFAMPLNPAGLRRNLRGQSGGKGRTELQAKVSAIGEAIERYCGVWRDDRPGFSASLTELGPQNAVGAVELLHFSQVQIRDREQTNATQAMFHRVTEPVADTEVIGWTPAWSLTASQIRYVPAAYCWYGHPEVRAKEFCLTDSNGAAAGNTHAEAVLQGFCELVERDSVALWWYHRSLLPGVDLASFEDPWIAGQVQFYRDELGRELWALDLTADLGIPAFAALSRLCKGETEDVLVGFGAHLDPALALGRALAELNQFLPSVVKSTSSNGDTRYAIDDEATVAWLTSVRVGEQPWLLPDPGAAETTAATYSDRGSGNLRVDVETCVKLAGAAGLEVLVVDQSRPELELAVVKVIVPGLRHFWRRLGPGRLWDVPARLGRRPLAVDESDINPYSVFF